MSAYATRVDIVNRGLQHCRRPRIVSFTDFSNEADAAQFSFDKLREAELGRNLWRFALRRTVLRPIDTYTAVIATSAEALSGTTLLFADTTGVAVGQLVTGTNIAAGTTVVSFVEDTSVLLSIAITGTVALAAAITFGPMTFLWTPPTYSAATTYLVGHVVVYASEWWQSKVSGNLANTPAEGLYWTQYVGPDTVSTWDTDTYYYPGELILGSNGSVYMALAADDASDPVATTGFWRIVNGTITGLSLLYPVGSGPWTDTRTSNVFRLPRGFLRQAPTDPKAGNDRYMGVQTGPHPDDWLWENNYVVSGGGSWGPRSTSSSATTHRGWGGLMLRYIANITDVTLMNALFCEALAARCAVELAPVLVEDALLSPILRETRLAYRIALRDARMSNALEAGPVSHIVSRYLTVRW